MTTLLLIKITLLLTVALLLTLALVRINPRWRILACEAAAIGVLALPLLNLLPRSVSLALPIGTTTALAQMESAAASGTVRAPLPSFQDESVEARRPDDAGSTGTVALAELSHGVSLVQMLQGVYLSVVLFLLVRYLWAFVRLRKAIAELDEADGSAQGRLGNVCQEMNLSRPPRLLVTDSALAPLAAGMGDGFVIIPRTMTGEAQEEVLGVTLRHEVHHLANHDLLRSGLLQFVATLLWFHPLAWMLRRAHSLALEELGDRVAAENTGTKRYSAILAELVLRLQRSRSLTIPATIGMLGSPQIIDRLERLRRSGSHRVLTPTRRGVVGLAAVIILFGLGVAQPDAGESKKQPTLADSLSKKDLRRTERSTKRALRFITDLQHSDGSFSAKQGGAPTHQTGTTALAAVVFSFHGGDDPRSELHAPMLRAFDYVVGSQDEHGMFRSGKKGGINNYHHFIATWQLARLHGRLDSRRNALIEKALPPAIGIILKAQQIYKQKRFSGGWRYSPQSKDSDISCTAWGVRALLAARAAGFAVPATAIDHSVEFMLRLQNPKDGGFAYVPAASPLGSNVARTGMALHVLQATGRATSPEADRAAEYILKNASSTQGQSYEFYGLFWCASGMAARGGEDATAFAAWMYPHCIGRQDENGGYTTHLGSVVPTLSVLLARAPDSLLN
jgi:beta-lactamase regulating signal transducer with metallopeptidase domain